MVKLLIADDDCIATIRAMRCQEEFYSPKDYIYGEDRVADSKKRKMKKDLMAIDEECRFRMIDWCCQVAEFLTVRREIVSIAVTYLDCYLSKVKEAREDRHVFQGIVIACLYTAMELHTNHEEKSCFATIAAAQTNSSSTTKLEPSFMALITQGAYIPSQIVKMQLEVMNTLRWRLNPPTARTFLQYYIYLVPSIMGKSTSTSIITSLYEEVEDNDVDQLLKEVAQQQIDVVEKDYQFLSWTKSSIALAALANAVHHVYYYYYNETTVSQVHHPIVMALSQYANIDIHRLDPDFSLLQQKLRQLILLPDFYHPPFSSETNQNKQKKNVRSEKTPPSSPRGIIMTKHLFHSTRRHDRRSSVRTQLTYK